MSKKTTAAIIGSKNEYIIQVKGNQKALYKQIKVNTSNEKPCIDSFVEKTHGRGRIEIRKIFVYNDIKDISPDWVGLKQVIRVERKVTTKKKESHQTAYYISSISSNEASVFGNHIRNHWGIETDYTGSKMLL